MKLQVWVMFLAVFIYICEAAAKPMNKDETQNELVGNQVEESQNVPDLHNKEADKIQMNKMERKIQGKKAQPASSHASNLKHPPCPKGQFHSSAKGKDWSKCYKGFTG